MDTHDRLQQLLRERGWTEYRLSKECGLAQSTIGNIFRRNTVPSIDTLELFDAWVCLKPNQKKAALLMMKAMRSDADQEPLL